MCGAFIKNVFHLFARFRLKEEKKEKKINQFAAVFNFSWVRSLNNYMFIFASSVDLIKF